MQHVKLAQRIISLPRKNREQWFGLEPPVKFSFSGSFTDVDKIQRLTFKRAIQNA